MKAFKHALAAIGGILIGCGAAAAADTVTPQIIGGTEAAKGAWPAVVAVEFKHSWGYQQDCGGTLIAANWVLTATHCIVDDNGKQTRFPSNTRVLVGTNDLTTGGKRIQAIKVIKHPNYNPDTTENDVALIKLASSVTNITPVPYITSTSTEATYAKTGTTAYVVGWGNTSKTGEVYPEKLRQLAVPILSLSVCNGANSYDGQLTTRMMCAGYMAGGKDSCQGDSGGPLFVKDASGKFRLQAGVVSFGQGCAVKNFPGIYARLAVLGPWITQTMKTQ